MRKNEREACELLEFILIEKAEENSWKIWPIEMRLSCKLSKLRESSHPG